MLSLIVNPSAGGGRPTRELRVVRQQLTNRGLPHHVTCTTSLEHAAELARTAVAAGEMPVAFGGDGLVGAVAGALSGSQAVFGVLPGGRGNDFARNLGLPLDAAAACGVIADGVPRAVDLGKAADRTFVGIATCGLDSVANRIANQTRLPLGRFVYAYAGLRALASWKAAAFNVRVDGADYTMRGYTVAVANSASHGGGMRLAPNASTRDGLLDVVLIADLSKPAFLRAMPKVFDGTHVRISAITVIRGREIEISCDRPFTMFADGDPLAELPVTLSVVPSAVRVMAPRRRRDRDPAREASF
jgi:YegS/Rv2252/BmrU family lipid kinase